ncbi:MAG: SEC-C metal-binding domain-containing protein [Chlamydia sp.]
MEKVQRNDVCPCGSGKKYKKCCALKDAAKKQRRFSGLKGLNIQAKKNETPMKSFAGKVFQVLSSTMNAPSSSLDSHSIKPQDHMHGDGCGCPGHAKGEASKKPGYATLEELIGMQTE